MDYYKKMLANKMDSSNTSSGSQFSGKTINKNKIRIKRKKKGINKINKIKETNFRGDDSMWKLISNDGDNSINTINFDPNVG